MATKAEPTVKLEVGELRKGTDHQFDFVNWLHWALWWQQCSYYMYAAPTFWTHPHLTSHLPPDQTTMGVPLVAGRDPTAGRNPPAAPPAVGIQIRIINGYETMIAPLWKRFVAEVIDTFFFVFIMKLYIPDFEYRIPEVFFDSSDVWRDISDEELLEIRRLIMLFLVSTVIQRCSHALLETVFLCVCGWTPGKWLLRLRVIRCTQSHLTRTVPGYSVRVEPGRKLSFVWSLLRSFFKGTVSVFIPLVIFFINVPHGRTRYDRLFGSIVVDVSTLNRPLFAGQAINFNFNQAMRRGQLHMQVR